MGEREECNGLCDGNAERGRSVDSGGDEFRRVRRANQSDGNEPRESVGKCGMYGGLYPKGYRTVSDDRRD